MSTIDFFVATMKNSFGSSFLFVHVPRNVFRWTTRQYWVCYDSRDLRYSIRRTLFSYISRFTTEYLEQ